MRAAPGDLLPPVLLALLGECRRGSPLPRTPPPSLWDASGRSSWSPRASLPACGPRGPRRPPLPPVITISRWRENEMHCVIGLLCAPQRTRPAAPGGLRPRPLQPHHHISFGAVVTCHFLSAEPFWELGNWTRCSASCGHLGARVRRPRCVTANGQEVSEALCHHLQKPLAGFQPCNIRDCPSR